MAEVTVPGHAQQRVFPAALNRAMPQTFPSSAQVKLKRSMCVRAQPSSRGNSLPD